MKLSDIARFWPKVSRADGCWNWSAGTGSTGYGAFWLMGKRHMKAHRFSALVVFGPVASQWHVLHSCDNPRCVNPAHLFLGAQRENVDDAVAKGRHGSPKQWGLTGTCKRGHDITDPANRYPRPGGGEDCKLCQRVRSQSRRARLRSAGLRVT